MRFEEYAYNASEVAQLERLLETMPEDRAVERMGLAYRLQRARARIAGVPVPNPPKKVYVTFRGRPVLDSAGIDANFGADAMGLFSDAIAMAVAGFAGDLKPTGRVPHREHAQPVITGVATGSFGFELEIPHGGRNDDREEDNGSDAEAAVKKLQELLTLSATGSDTQLSEIADDIHPRAVKKVVALLKLMQRHDARFALGFDGKDFRFDSIQEISDTAERLSDRNLREETFEMVGTFIGALPATRRFQINRRPDGVEIEGKIGRDIRDVYRLAQQYSNRNVSAKIRLVQVGQGTPRYTLMGIDDAEGIS